MNLQLWWERCSNLDFLKIDKCFDGITCVRNGERIHSASLNHGSFGFCRCSLIFSCSCLGEILFCCLAVTGTLSTAGVIEIFVSKGGIPHCGDGWLAPLERSFEGHSPRVAATVRKKKHFQQCTALLSVGTLNH